MEKKRSLLGKNSSDREASEIELYVISLIKKAPRAIAISDELLKELDSLPIDARDTLLLSVEAAVGGIHRNFMNLRLIRKYLKQRTLKVIK